ncbi:alpha,alpha-phosphotrehalase [Salisediminibacterium selenitireducens]|uniref:Alpha,alpha-phosphotrehalase n=1 Tax=Bacillus selenitireducens (strain ATCC 700615 / DSM 15326 / MLS10) TaxID=439292 RepID=D6XYH3_BACIE|nr:alpha,alpha-phosphotrehalase [Salisediminibacterium selenitireducens]ADI00242.1 alpha,alpha-phosphotrehalase [[Bacillus] selenitireducens MLS10]
MARTMNEWWRKAAVYQIYPKSFNDTTGNGTGDIQGIIDKLDYINELGTDVIWLTPIYASPQKDNGYDIADYFSIHHEYGTMADFDRLLEGAHERGIKVIMDIVVNHTSTDHEWFQQARSSKENPYRNYYIWKDPVDGREPTNWQSKFGGNAWAYDEATGQYYLHLFDITQADLNWENEDVRRDVYDMMHFWFKKGVDGFRLDVINLISKDQAFPDDDGSTAPGDGRKFYTDGPRVHEFMHEMNKEVFSHYDAMTVGEMSSTTIDHCIKYTRPDREELDMTFNFHHLKVDYPNGEKWALADFDFIQLKEILSEWQTKMHEGGGWNALFWCNHDQPRVVSRYGDDRDFHKESAKMLATTVHMMQGTPYIYQGEEFGMTNPKFDSIDDYRDVETLNFYQDQLRKGRKPEELMPIIQAKSRDNSRTPVQWNAGKNGGFTDGTPWIPVPDVYESINAEAALRDQDSIFYHYKDLIRLRKELDIITTGNYQVWHLSDPRLFVYTRETETEMLLVVSHFYKGNTTLKLPDELRPFTDSAELILSNKAEAPDLTDHMPVGSYDSHVYLMTKS